MQQQLELQDESADAAVDTAVAGGDLNGDGKIVVGYISKNTVDVFHAPMNDAAEESFTRW